MIEALFERQIQRVVELAEDALDAPDSWQGLVGFLTTALEQQAADRGLKDVLFGASCPDHARIQRGRDRVVPLLERLVDRARSDGHLRPDVGASDVVLLQLTLATAGSAAAEVRPDTWRRLLAIVLDGLRVSRDAPTPLPGAPLDDAGLRAVIGSRGHRCAAHPAEGSPAHPPSASTVTDPT